MSSQIPESFITAFDNMSKENEKLTKDVTHWRRDWLDMKTELEKCKTAEWKLEMFTDKDLCDELLRRVGKARRDRQNALDELSDYQEKKGW